MSRSFFPAMLLLALWACNVACDRQKKDPGLVHPEISPEINESKSEFKSNLFGMPGMGVWGEGM